MLAYYQNFLMISHATGQCQAADTGRRSFGHKVHQDDNPTMQNPTGSGPVDTVRRASAAPIFSIGNC